MKSFSELLSEYVNRIGVSDAVLARRLGVSRQTVFRWRQGLTQRPRHRQDVMALAAKLRLEADERDQFLMAAGFPPETALPPAEALEASIASAQEVSNQSETGGGTPGGYIQPGVPISSRRFRAAWLIPAVIGSVLLLAGLISSGAWRSVISGLGWTVRSGAVSEPRRATPDETLILVSPFANYASEKTGFNVAGRLQEALRDVFGGSGLENVRVEVLPGTILEEMSAQQAGLRLNADLVIWGEYDSGRVVAHVSAPTTEGSAASNERRWLIETGEGLGTTINTDLPQDIQWMALFALGQVHYQAGRDDKAEAAFQRALVDPPEDPGARGAIFSYLGSLESRKPATDFDKVIAYYTEAIELLPDQTTAWNNRGVAYLQRGHAGDLHRAEEDFRQVILARPNFSSASLNLAYTLLHEDPDRLDEPLALLEQAEEYEPDLASIQNSLCWDLSLAGNPAQALPHCDKAIRLDPSGYSNDSRGVALAMLGRHSEAISEFRIFLSTLQSEDPSAYARYSATRTAWIVALEKGLDPFDAATRRGLLQE
ncbi:MAG TPA: tetratricopeptide repeat protein [Anaerolineales bacterium]|nr:tetratricopeptide repeat protein [Anaerolineales bacterium]